MNTLRHPRFLSLVSTFSLFAFLLVFCCACNEHAQDAKNGASQSTKGAEQERQSIATPSGVIHVSVAPFDAYPNEATFGFQIRFSQPIVTRGEGRGDTPTVDFTPTLPGSFSWRTDSEIVFSPRYPIPAGSRYDVDLGKLTLPKGFSLDTNHITVVMPEPTLKIASCNLRTISTDPVTKTFVGSLYLNYSLNGYYIGSMLERQALLTSVKNHLSLKKISDDKEENVPLKVEARDYGLNVESIGNDMLRPGKDGTFHFKVESGLVVVGGKSLPGVECDVHYLDTEWRTELSEKLADSEAAKMPVKANPSASLGVSARGKESLEIEFLDPIANYKKVSHKRTVGELIEKGLTIVPSVEGQWKVGPNTTDLTFEPKKEWTPGQKYTVTLDPTEFPELALQRTSVPFEAHSLRGNISRVDAGTVPEDRARRVVSAEVVFNYPVDAEKLEKLFSVRVSEKGRKNSDVSKRFSIVKGELPNVVFVKSEALDLKEYPLIVEFEAFGSLQSSLGGNAEDIKLHDVYDLPSRLEIFSIAGADISVAKSSKEELQRIVTITTSEDVDESSVTQNIEVELLPDCKEKKNKKICDEDTSFSNEAQITPLIENQSEKIPVSFVSRSENGAQETFSYSFQASGKRQVLVKIKQGLTSKLGFPLSHPYREVLHLKEYPKRLSVMLDGSLLSLSGSKRLGILAQNVRKIRYRLSRVKATDLHHLIYVTSGSFQQPTLDTTFTYDDVTQPYEFLEELPEAPSGKPAYTSIDFSRFMASGGDIPRGLFYLEVNESEEKKLGSASISDSTDSEEESSEGNSECDPESEECPTQSDEAVLNHDSRLILLTDLGLVVKRELAGGDRVYVASFRQGVPVAGAKVKLLSRNGNTLFTVTSDKNGEALFPKSSDFTKEKEAVLYTAEKDGDLTFIPYQKRDREINFSRFDVGGVVNSEEPDALRALIFTDRGIYRPGEKVQFGFTVRNRDFSALSSELPLTVRISDPKGQSIAQDVVRFSKSGLADYAYETNEAGITGTYRAAIMIPARSGIPERELAGLDFRVEEFEPDRLSIKAALGVDDPGVFKKLSDLQAKATLKNLFGVAAVGNTVKASFVVDPWSGQLAGFPGFNFRPMLEFQNRQHSVLDLGESKTDASGEATFSIDVPDVSGVVLEGVLAVEGFEKESGRSVATTARGLVTDLSILLGVRSEDPLGYVSKGALRRISVQAIDLKGERVMSGDVTVSLDREEYKNILVKQPNGVFKYESAKKLVPVSTEVMNIAPEGRSVELQTQEPGTFVLHFRTPAGVLLNEVRYSVMGEGNDAIRINRNANLEVTLNQSSYNPGAEVEVAIKGPYAGFGVITVEREKVLTTTWFKAEGTSSVQKVRLPSGIVGNAYVTVLLARAWDSKEIYLPPLSYATLPLKIDEDQYLAPPKLDLPSVIKPGTKATIHYVLPEEGSVIIYGVDEGILQFAKYRAPDPLKFLMPKRALEVETRTALDMVMPDYSIVQSVLSTGGDEDVDISKFQNPFKKRSRPPLAVWSGIIHAKAGSGDFEFAVPDYFDGAVKVFVYFVGDKRVGISQGRIEIRGDFVIKPNVATFAAPGDIFELPVEVTNTRDQQDTAKVTLSATGLEVVGAGEQTLTLKPSAGEVAHFKVRAQDTLGEARFTLTARGAASERTISDGVSIRPASPLMRTVSFGVFDPEKPGDTAQKEVKNIRTMYAELRSSEAFISHSAGLFVDALNQFMEGYPYGCSEQLTSKGFISLLMMNYSEDPALKELSKGKVEKTVRMLSSRMNADGSIAYWRRGDVGDPFVSVYATHFLLDAAEKGIQPPHWFLENVKTFLKTKSKENQFDLFGLFTQAYALYLRARLGEVVTPELTSMVGRLEAVDHNKWQGSAISWLVGATYSQMRIEDKAKSFTADSVETRFSDLPFPLSQAAFNSGLINYLKVRHFSGALSKDVVFSLLNRLDGDAPDSLSASALALGLLGGPAKPEEPGSLSITSEKGALDMSGTVIHRTSISSGTKGLTFSGPREREFFYSLVESGFDRAPAQQGSRSQGVSVSRDVVDSEGKSVSTLRLGETYKVILRVQSEKAVADFAVQDLLPAGFEPDLEALKDRKSVGAEANAWQCENVDVRDDRLILFGDLSEGAVVFSYPVKPTVRGQLVWPGIYGEAMYNARVYSWEKSGSVTVE